MPELVETATGLIERDEIVTVTAEDIAGASFVCGSRGLCPESSYFLDCSVEILDMTPDVSSWVRAGFDLDGYLDNYSWAEQPGARHGDRLHDCSRGIRSQYLAALPNCSPEERVHHGMALLFGIKQQFREFHWGVSDACAKYALDCGFDTIGQAEDIRARIAESRRLTDWVADLRWGLPALREQYQQCDRAQLLQQMQQRINRVEEAILRVPGHRQKATRIDRKVAKQVRQAVKKSSALFVRMIGDQQLRDFLADRPFVLPGTLFDYRVEKTMSVISHTADPRGGHIPYRLAIIDRQSGNDVADACVYFERTPILDQIVALSMFIQSDQERHLLSSANFFNRANDFAANPVMKELGKVTSYDERRQRGTEGEVTEEERTRALDDIIRHLDNLEVAVVDNDDDERHDGRVRRAGVSHRQFREEVIPWRARLHDPIIQVLAEDVGLSVPQMRRIISGDDNVDRIVFSRELPATLDGFIDRHFVALLT